MRPTISPPLTKCSIAYALERQTLNAKQYFYNARPLSVLWSFGMPLVEIVFALNAS